MAFKVVEQLPDTKWPVAVSQPIDGGKVEQHEFTAVFKPMSQRDYDQAIKKGESDAQFIRSFLVGWEGLQDEDGNDIPFKPDFIDELMQFPFVRTGIIRAYQQMVSGIAAKN